MLDKIFGSNVALFVYLALLAVQVVHIKKGTVGLMISRFLPLPTAWVGTAQTIVVLVLLTLNLILFLNFCKQPKAKE